MHMPDLTTTYLGLRLCSPLVASPSPATSRVESLLHLEDQGVGAVVLPSLFEEEIEAEEMTLHDRLEEGAGISPEAQDFFPRVDLGHLTIDRHLRLVQDAALRLSVPVIASVNGRSPGGWVRYARELQDAGASAIELNMYDVAADPTMTAAQVEAGYLELVAEVRASVDVPVAVKVSAYFTSFANFATGLVGAGADGLVLFNRFYQPDLDLQTLDVTPTLDLSHPGEHRLPLRWIAILRPVLPTVSLAMTSGVHSGTDAVKGLLAGADVVMIAAALLRHGLDRAGQVIREVDAWMEDNDMVSVDQLRGSVAQHTAEDPGAFERAQYQRVLASWRR